MNFVANTCKILKERGKRPENLGMTVFRMIQKTLENEKDFYLKKGEMSYGLNFQF